LEIGMLFAYLRSFAGQRLCCIAERPAYEVAIAPDSGWLLQEHEF